MPVMFSTRVDDLLISVDMKPALMALGLILRQAQVQLIMVGLCWLACGYDGCD
jgi:hypothetical protein